VFDAHAHLHAPPPPGIHGAVLPGVHASPHAPALLADPRVVPALGLHPWHLSDDIDRTLVRLEELVEATVPRAIGETGLDRSRRGAPRALQERAFAAQIALARRRSLPLILHVVRSHGACLEALRGFPFGGMVHDFQGPVEEVRRWVRAGFALSISPHGLDKTALIAAIPEPWLLVETDELGCERLGEVVAAVAAARGVRPEDVAEVTERNARRVLAVPARRVEGAGVRAPVSTSVSTPTPVSTPVSGTSD
jgi:TatD DNase family protein